MRDKKGPLLFKFCMEFKGCHGCLRADDNIVEERKFCHVLTPMTHRTKKEWKFIIQRREELISEYESWDRENIKKILREQEEDSYRIPEWASNIQKSTNRRIERRDLFFTDPNRRVGEYTKELRKEDRSKRRKEFWKKILRK